MHFEVFPELRNGSVDLYRQHGRSVAHLGVLLFHAVVRQGFHKEEHSSCAQDGEATTDTEWARALTELEPPKLSTMRRKTENSS